jgi:uncharacterized protein
MMCRAESRSCSTGIGSNVAVSRAKYASIVVRSQTLTDYLPSTPDRLVELGAFLSLAPDTEG